MTAPAVLAIDPGIKPGAVVLATDGTVLHVTHRLVDVTVWSRERWPLVVTELQWYHEPKRGERRKDVNSILKLAFRAGFTLASFPAQRRMALAPRVWRGASNATKEQVQARIARELTPDERALFRDIPKSRHGDVLDAIGIGRAALRLATLTTEHDYDLI